MSPSEKALLVKMRCNGNEVHTLLDKVNAFRDEETPDQNLWNELRGLLTKVLALLNEMRSSLEELRASLKELRASPKRKVRLKRNYQDVLTDELEKFLNTLTPDQPLWNEMQVQFLLHKVLTLLNEVSLTLLTSLNELWASLYDRHHSLLYEIIFKLNEMLSNLCKWGESLNEWPLLRNQRLVLAQVMAVRNRQRVVVVVDDNGPLAEAGDDPGENENEGEGMIDGQAETPSGHGTQLEGAKCEGKHIRN